MKILKKDIELKKELMPKHVAIIMDGNGTWAKKRGLPRTAGHKVGADRIFDIVECAKELDIKAITVFAFSTENWKRPKEEVEYIFKLLEDAFDTRFDKFKKENVKVTMSGTLDRLVGQYDSLKEKIEKVIEETKNNTGTVLNVAFNYGGQDEIVRATKKIAKDVCEGNLAIEDINDKVFTSYLSTKDLPDVDLMIRTSGQQRISNFLLWQVAYAEFIFTNTLWPDFDGSELKKCIYEYQKRDRRFGNVK